MRRTLRGRVSLFAVAVIAGWLAVLTVLFNAFLGHRLRTQVDATLKVRAEAAAATIQLAPGGRVTVGEVAGDGDLDTGIWIYSGTRHLERPPTAGPSLQRVADGLRGSARRYVDASGVARFYVVPVVVHDRRVATVVAGVTTTGEHRAERLSLLGSLVVSVLVLAVAYPVFRIAVRRALDPVDAMARQAADWGAHETERRFGSNQRFVEMRELAGDLDGLLDRLSAVLRHERRLSGELSHELRTPLSAITAEAELLVRSGRTADRAAHLTILETARRMDRIIDTLLAAAHEQSGELVATCSIGDVLAAVDNARAAVRGDDSDAVLGIEATLAERIFAPVLENARRYAATAVTVATDVVDGWVHVDISNDGPRVERSSAERIFEPGYRGDRTDGHSGAGLGLALARRLARSAHGDVELVDGPHTTFRITLPAG